MKYGTRHRLSDQALAEVAAQRGREVTELRLMLAIVERERDDALARVHALEACVDELMVPAPLTGSAE